MESAQADLEVQMETILCLDQATHTTGYSVWQESKMIAQGKFSYEDTNLPERLHKIKLHVLKLIKQYNIKKLYLEDIQQQEKAGVTTYKVLAELIGILQDLAFENQLDCELIPSSVWKSACGIKGRARAEQKANAQKHVQVTYGLKVTQDEADAICIGECVISRNQCAWAD